MTRRRRPRKRRSRKRLAYGIIAVAFILIILTFTYFSLHQSNQTSVDHETPPQAAIVDHLNFTGQSNPTFVEECINILDEGGLTWKYYRGEDVTVDFYRELPSRGTSLIILRVHSAIMKVNGEIIPLLGLFTSEPYSDEAAREYRDDVRNDRLVKAFFTEGGGEYFGIVPKFVKESMKGKFENAIIIMMGCEGLGYEGLTYTDMAEAFITKGAKVYISWDGPVGVNHTDQTTVQLLQSLILEKRTIKDAVEEISPDLAYNSTMQYYPKTVEVGNYVVPTLKNSLTTNVAQTNTICVKSRRFQFSSRSTVIA